MRWDSHRNQPVDAEGEPLTNAALVAIASEHATATSFGHHTLAAFQTCNKHAQLSKELRLREAVQPIALMIGSGVHMGLNVWYTLSRHFTDETPKDDRRAARQQAMDAGAVLAYASGEVAPLTPVDHKVAAAVQTAYLLSHYFNHYTHEAIEIISTEKAFVIPELDGYTGRADGIVRYKPGYQLAGHYFVMETKTTSDDDLDRFTEQFQISRDVTGYLVGAMHTFDVPFSGILLNVIGKTDPPTFFRIPVLRSPEDIKLWMHETLQIVNMYKSCRSSGVWPRNTDMCSRWAGWNRPCVYKTVCRWREDERIIENMFYRVPQK